MHSDPSAAAPSFDTKVGASRIAIDGGELLVVSPVLPSGADLDPAGWALANRAAIDAALHREGALLLRGFGSANARFADVIAATSNEWAGYREPATPRKQVAANIYTSTEYPQEQEIPLHNENSHCTSWPLRIYFNCVTPPGDRGQTPFADCRGVLRRLPPDIVQRFVERRWRYVRNFGGGLGFSWQKVFDTDSRDAVDAYCRANGMSSEWRADGALRVTYVRDALGTHPVTGESVWFNHGLFFNPVSIDPELRDMLLESYTPDELPYNTSYGDGTPIEADVLDTLREAYARETRCFDWQAGDLLMLDNMLMAHGRRPFDGERRIVVGMADPYPA
ncbi:TauD/TfdA family dioxygenase [Burkholderia gladioli]|uniref:TauD/TfdA family dioxygenase n=1 Tax=Burkholderia gladioli TaxID=28095 RepID=UPI00064B714F|nr:TauD/TfdA family dioxygenase [Burkholderia gladioli]MDA0576225.1 TauD/TfdA family dioxygenase [Burkholderia gladioli]MDA0604320.1 TauD/TfdA family dioxygenase [Burkholderia gladioli]